MIMSEWNKLPALSLEVKNSKQYGVTFRTSRNALRKKKELVFTREEESMLIIS